MAPSSTTTVDSSPWQSPSSDHRRRTCRNRTTRGHAAQAPDPRPSQGRFGHSGRCGLSVSRRAAGADRHGASPHAAMTPVVPELARPVHGVHPLDDSQPQQRFDKRFLRTTGPVRRSVSTAWAARPSTPGRRSSWVRRPSRGAGGVGRVDDAQPAPHSDLLRPTAGAAPSPVCPTTDRTTEEDKLHLPSPEPLLVHDSTDNGGSRSQPRQQGT